MKSQRILIITPSLGTGGAQKVFHDQLPFYSRHGTTTGCIFNWDGALEEEKSVDLVSLDVPAGGNWFSKFYFFCQRVVRLRRLKKDLDIDISISHLEGADYINILSRRREKVICYIHGTKFRDGAIRGTLGWVRKKVLMPWLYRKADVIITVSRGIQDEFLNQLAIPQQKMEVITNSIDLQKIENLSGVEIADEVRSMLAKHKTVCLCSRLAPQKNHEAFLSIFNELSRKLPCKLIILGDGELRMTLIERAVQLGLKVFHVWSEEPFFEEADIFFMGNQLNPFPYISKSSLFALPSAWEGFPLALCEAMACEVPVVSSDCPTGPKEILHDDATDLNYGFLLPIPKRGDTETNTRWTTVLNDILIDHSLAKEYSMKAKERLKKFGKEKMEQSWLDIIHS